MSKSGNGLDGAASDGVFDVGFVTFVNGLGFAFVVDFEDVGVRSGAKSASDAKILIDIGFNWHGFTSEYALIISRIFRMGIV